ncbi:MAG: hypothetical protein A2X86_10775 [Bdellovibrionales bacterium GWA2_49_15]|nr:MAG: hypothetical protein A2X86_10775 [Bdellovibrionales bacterium GWA2_49_15]HAZ11459.1 hypothetical protein [Bdellovibrionales bacterium]
MENGHIYLPIEQNIGDLLGITKDTELNLRTDGTSLVFSLPTKQSDCEETLPPLPTVSMPTKMEEEYTRYWNLAAQEGMREKFMGSLRTILRARLNYDYNELLCEKEAIKLCYKYYKAREKGEELPGPYIPEWRSITPDDMK